MSASADRLRQEEQEILNKFEAKAQQLKAANPGWTIERCRGLAVLALPRLYSEYMDVKGEMNALGVRPSAQRR